MGNGFISDTFSERSERPEGGRGMELIYYLIPFIVYLYDMDNINTEIIKKLLNALVSPIYPELIQDYMVISSEVGDFRAVAVGVIVNPEKYNEMTNYTYAERYANAMGTALTGNPFDELDKKVEKDVKDALKYLGLGPINSTVSLYVSKN